MTELETLLDDANDQRIDWVQSQLQRRGGVVMTQLSNGLGRSQAIARSLDEAEDELVVLGYEPDPHGLVKRLPDGSYVATAWGGQSGRFRAEAIGSTAVGAARSLIKTLRLR